MSVLSGAQTPQESTRAFAASISRGDLDGAAYCFAKDACLVTPDATTVRGRDEIRPILHQLIVLESQIEVQESSVQLAGEVALGTERWTVTSPDSEGGSFTRSLTPMMVLQQLEGVWKLAIALPWWRG
ncbi:MAG TPA: nuclear transport factor 2 family protein [Solirubrobacterales bacterium]|jgi:ketosteroid isomerase-like protein|nr:nuclear transport factor 2 family protein [Solirubrobacterales bacterium]